MRDNKDPIQLIAEKFHNNCAGFVQLFTKIFYEQDGVTKQEIYPKQLAFLNGIKPEERVIAVIKSRQSGFTTSILARVLWESYFAKKNEILVASATERQAMRSLSRLRWYFDSMPDFMRPEFVVESKQELKLKNGTTIYSLPSNPTAMRGFTNASILLDEFGVQSEKDSEEIWAALLPVITKDGRIVAVSTPKGNQNIFYQLCNPQKDEDGKPVGIQSDKIIKVDWKSVPHVKKAVIEYDLRNKMLPEQFAQEYECVFLGANIDFAIFEQTFLEDKFIADNIFFINLEPVLKSEDPSYPDYLELDKKYPKGLIMGWDAAISYDGSILSVWGITKDDVWEQIALHQFPKNTEITNQCKFAVKLGNWLNIKKLCYDATGGLGKSVGSILKDDVDRKFQLEPVVFTVQMKAEQYSHLKKAMEDGKMKSPYHKEMMRQFTLLAENNTTGRIGATGSHRTNHDDIPSAILCAFYGRQRRIVQPGISLYTPHRKG